MLLLYRPVIGRLGVFGDIAPMFLRHPILRSDTTCPHPTTYANLATPLPYLPTARYHGSAFRLL